MALKKMKEIIDEMVEIENFHISYVSFRQFYINNTLNEDIRKFIVEKKKAISLGYYVDEDNITDFKAAIYKQFGD